jgi:hypothetical protein
MTIDVFDTFDSFVALQSVWEAIYDSDPEAHYFLSWPWLAEVFRANPGHWRVLAARADHPGSDYVGFFPIRVKLHRTRSRSDWSTELEVAGRLAWAPYAGFLCEPEWEDQAIPALAGRLREMPWSKLTLKHWSSSERRKQLFLGELPDSDYGVTHQEYVKNQGTVDSLVCPYVELPGDYETYLETCVSSNTRQKIRRFSRRIEASEKLRITVTDSEMFDRNLEILLALWAQKWSTRRSRDQVDRVVDRYRDNLLQIHALDAVFLPMLWRGATPLGGLGNVVDRRRRRLYFLVAGRDESAAEPFVGLMLHAFAIRWAIENGLRTYDLCHGDEPYKYSLGATDRRVALVDIQRRAGVEPGWLDPSTLTRVLQRTRTPPPRMPPRS